MVPTGAVFPQVGALPGAHGKAPLADRDGQFAAGQHRADDDLLDSGVLDLAHQMLVELEKGGVYMGMDHPPSAK